MTNAAASKWPHPPTNKKINGKKWPNWDPQLHLMLYLDNGIWSWGSYTVTLHCDCDEQQTQWGPGQGKRCCSVGFLCSFFSGSPSQVTFHLAGGGGGGTFFLSWIQTVQSAFPPDWDLITTQTTALPDVWIALMHISFFISQSTCKVIRHHYMRSGRHADELAKTGSPSVSNDDVI